MDKIIKCKECGKILEKGHVLDHYLEKHNPPFGFWEKIIRFFKNIKR